MDHYAEALNGVVLDGRYRVGRMIARGGMSTVYRGLDTRLDRAVAIKVMSPSYLTDPTFALRFEREARSAAALDHRGVVAVYDQGRDGDAVFLVMELVDGGTLRDLLRERGSLDVPLTLSILEPLLAALGAAHAGGIVHRDVKPENVLISSRGEVKVADFGLAKAVSSQTMATGELILGTVAYLSPEQVATGAADSRSDVYSAGIVAFEMLTGNPPYVGDNAIAVAYQHVHSDVPAVTDDAPGVPLELDDLILAATRRDPDARPRDAATFLSDVIRVRARLGFRRVPVPPPRPLLPRPTTNSNVPTDRARGPQGTAMVKPARARPTAAHPTASAEPTTAAHPTADPHPTAAGPPNQPPSRIPTNRRRIRRWLIAILVVLLLGGAAAVGGWWLGSGRWAYAPKSVGVDLQTAQQQVRSAGLVPTVTSAPNNSVPAGTIVSSDPTDGSRELRGSQITLGVSTGRPRVPALDAGSSVEIAEAQIASADLVPVLDSSKNTYSPGVPSGSVIGTNPAPGTGLDIGSPVTLVLSKGPAPVQVPDMTGKSLQDAQNALIAGGLTVGKPTNVFDIAVDAGTVIGSTPMAGLIEPRGSSVSLTLAVSLTVPTVRSQTVAAARALLRTGGFAVTVGDPVFDSGVDGGSAVGTNPTAGTRIDPKYPQVTITPSNAVTVPDLTRSTISQATQTLDALGLSVTVDSLFGRQTANVTGQDPDPGTRVAPGAIVIISSLF